MLRLFLSHATRDAELVELIRTRLASLDVELYTAEHDVRTGENVHDKIAAAIERSHLVVVLFTSAGYDSRYVHQEIGYARRAKKLIVPLVTRDAAALGLGMLEGIEYIVVDEADPTSALHRLSLRIEEIAQRKSHEGDLAVIALALVTVGVVLIVMRQ